MEISKRRKVIPNVFEDIQATDDVELRLKRDVLYIHSIQKGRRKPLARFHKRGPTHIPT